VDFTSIEDATAALTSPKNHRLDGRELVVEYASPEAVRRGGGALKSTKEGTTGKVLLPRGKVHRPRTTPRRHDLAQAKKTEEEEAKAEEGDSPSVPANKGARRDKVAPRRAKPGAALAQAKRESAAIVPSQGQKIKF
jgi:RNA recognition motif-containing protein